MKYIVIENIAQADILLEALVFFRRKNRNELNGYEFQNIAEMIGDISLVRKEIWEEPEEEEE